MRIEKLKLRWRILIAVVSASALYVWATDGMPAVLSLLSISGMYAVVARWGGKTEKDRTREHEALKNVPPSTWQI